jgi:hypothetical protein
VVETRSPKTGTAAAPTHALPVDFPPAPLVKHYFTVWTRDGTLNRLHNLA